MGRSERGREYKYALGFIGVASGWFGLYSTTLLPFGYRRGVEFSCNVNGDMNWNCLFVHHLLNFSPSQIYMGH